MYFSPNADISQTKHHKNNEFVVIYLWKLCKWIVKQNLRSKKEQTKLLSQKMTKHKPSTYVVG